jgi:hypothetical protein
MHLLKGMPNSFPEAFMVSLNYDHWKSGQCKAIDILALMLSIPECLSPKTDLYNHREQYNCEYILKGVVTFSGSHYVSYIRNLKTKVKYICD